MARLASIFLNIFKKYKKDFVLIIITIHHLLSSYQQIKCRVLEIQRSLLLLFIFKNRYVLLIKKNLRNI